MESRTEFEGRIHFFEYFSLEKFEESLRSALQYSIGIITQQDRFIQYYQYSKEISFALEFCINLPFALKYNASYAEYFYGFVLKGENSKIKRLLILLFRLLYPYILQKMNESKTQGWKKKILDSLYKIIKLWDILIKLKYLLDEDHPHYSIFYLIIRQNLTRFKMESPYKHAMLIVYLFLKFLDFYFQKKSTGNNVDQVIPAPKNIDGKLVQKYCPKCKRAPQIPSVLKTTGFVYCLECLQQMVIEKQITNDHIIKLF